MGVVAKQTIKSSLYVYLGIFISVITNLYIWPLCFDVAQIGVLRVVVDIGVSLTVFVTFGLPATISRFFPYFKNPENNNNGFLSLILKYTLLGTILFSVCFVFIQPVMINFYAKDSPLLSDFITYILVFTLINSIISIMESYLATHLKIVIPKIIKDFLLRVVIIIISVLFFFKIITFDVYLLLYTLSFLLVLISLIIYAKKMNILKASKNIIFPSESVKKQILNFNIVIVIGGIGGLLLTKVDVLLIAAAPNGDYNNGIYTTMFLLASIIELPGRSLAQISLPIIAEHTKNDNSPAILKMYKESSIIQFSVAIIIFCLIWSNMGNIFGIMPKGDKFILGKYAFLYLALAQIFNMSTSLNASILSVTKHYYVIIIITNVLGLLAIALNLFLIPMYGIEGAAISTASTIILLHAGVLLFVWLKLRMFPYTVNTIKPIIIALVVLGTLYFIPFLMNYYIDGIFRTVFIIGAFALFLIRWNVSPYFNDFYRRIIDFLIKKASFLSK